jgi:hypothetical protein
MNKMNNSNHINISASELSMLMECLDYRFYGSLQVKRWMMKRFDVSYHTTGHMLNELKSGLFFEIGDNGKRVNEYYGTRQFEGLECLNGKTGFRIRKV